MPEKILIALACFSLFASAPRAAADPVDVRDFAHLASGGDWAPAIQAALDSVNAGNGYFRGGEIYFPPGDYRVDDTIVVGRNPEHWGLRLVGYGARLVGSEALDRRSREADYRQRMETLTGGPRRALPCERELGNAIMELHGPPGFEGGGFVIEGLAFDREKPLNGIGIKVPAQRSRPKGTVFRNLVIRNQDIGFYSNFGGKFRFYGCLFRGNRVGLHGHSHFNNVAISGCTFSANHHHGVEISNAGQWGSNAIRISECLFEHNGGYGIRGRTAGEMTVTGCLFRENGSGIGAFGNFISIDTNQFIGFYGEEALAHGPPETGGKVNPHAGRAHVVIGASRSVQLRNNNYRPGAAILLVGVLRADGNHLFDALPVSAVEFPDGFSVAADGLGGYRYCVAEGAFGPVGQ